MKPIEEFVALCQRVTEDGQLSDREVFELQEWIDAHPEWQHDWPVSKLAFHVGRALADGHVDETELIAIGPVLIEIETQWSAQQSRVVAQAAADSFDLTEAKLPLLNISLGIECVSDAAHYQVELSESRCACPEWQQRRQAFPAGHIGRCCKHVAHAFHRVTPETGWPGWLAALVEDCVSRDRGVSPREDWRVIRIENSEYLVSTASEGWANVFAPTGKTAYGRFGYHIVNRRWSYGIAPPSASTIATAVHQWLSPSIAGMP